MLFPDSNQQDLGMPIITPTQRGIGFIEWINQIHDGKSNAERIFDTYLETQPHTKGIMQVATTMYKNQQSCDPDSRLFTTHNIHRALGHRSFANRQFILFLISTDGFQLSRMAETHNIQGDARYRNEIRQGKKHENIPTGLS